MNTAWPGTEAAVATAILCTRLWGQSGLKFVLGRPVSLSVTKPALLLVCCGGHVCLMVELSSGLFLSTFFFVLTPLTSSLPHLPPPHPHPAGDLLPDHGSSQAKITITNNTKRDQVVRCEPLCKYNLQWHFLEEESESLYIIVACPVGGWGDEWLCSGGGSGS